MKKNILILVLLVPFFAYNANISTSGLSTNWFDPAAWAGGVVPGVGDNARIYHNINLNMTGNVTVGGILFSWPSSPATLTVTTTNPAYVFTVLGTTTIKGTNGTFVIDDNVNLVTNAINNNQGNFVINDNASVTVTNDVSLATPQTFTVGDNSTVTIGTDITSSGGTIDIGTGSTITVGDDFNFAGSGTTVNIGAGSLFDVADAMSVTGGVNILNISGAFEAQSLSASGGSQEINILSGGSFTIYDNVTFSGSAGFDISNAGLFDIGGDMSMVGGTSGTVDGVLDVTGNLNLNNGVTITGTGSVTAGSYTGGGTIFGQTASSISGGSTLLPIELTFFNVNIKDGKVNIVWQTASEESNDYFTIERSVNGINFEPIAKVVGSGNSSQALNYKYIDNNPLSGVAYYRLRQTDYSGVSEVFNIVSVNNNNASTEAKMEIQTEGVLVELGAEYDNISVVAYNIIGNVVFSNLITEKATSVFVNKGSLPSGMVILKIQNGSGLKYTGKVSL